MESLFLVLFHLLYFAILVSLVQMSLAIKKFYNDYLKKKKTSGKK